MVFLSWASANIAQLNAIATKIVVDPFVTNTNDFRNGKNRKTIRIQGFYSFIVKL